MKWECKYLHEIATTSSGGTPSRTVEKYWNGNIPWIKSGQLKDGYITDCDEFITEDGMKNSSASLVLPGTLLLALYGATAGKLAFTSIEATTNQAVCAISTNDKLVNNKYLFYFLLSRRAQILNDAAGGAQPNISQGYVKNIKVPLPPLHIQEQIADTLDKADALRRKDQELLQKYDQLAQAIFYDMFGDPETNEKGWEKVLFGSLINSIRYGTGSPPKYSDEGIPFIRATNIKEGRIVDKGMVYLNEKEASKISKCYINEGDLIIVRSGVNTGDCGIIPNKHHGSLAGYDLIIEINKPLGVFYHFLINSIWGQKMIKPLSRRAAQPHLNAEQVKNLEFILPDNKALERFSDVLNKIEIKRDIVLATQNQTSFLNNTLASSFFS
jgi:type I restriction enzyme S subunit